MNEALNVLSLFAGIGGLDLGLERAGMHVVGQVEIDPYCRDVLTKHWKDVPRHDDVRTCTQWWLSRPRPIVDVIAGGYPCGPFSTAGWMRGEDDPLYLWPAFADVLRALRPRYAILENVPAHLGLGFDRVLADLADLGFDAEWSIVPASDTRTRRMRRLRPPVLAFYRTWAVDHRTPLADGGSNEDTNLQLLCDPCHAAKTRREATARAARRRQVAAV